MKVVTVEQMRQAERDCARLGISTDTLMENAGQAVAEEVRCILGTVDQKRILILIGPGNNGGDGLVAARHWHDWGAEVNVYLLGKSGDANLEQVQERRIDCVEAAGDAKFSRLAGFLESADIVVDAIFGTGKSRALSGVFPEVLGMVRKTRENRAGLRVIALDLPSGLDADSGAVDPACLYADNTVTLGFPKLGLFNSPGSERAGRITVVDIGLPDSLVEKVTTGLVTGAWARAVLPRRSLTANKGTFGRVLVIAGSINYIGAAYLACNGALRVGAGLVTLATAASLQPILASKLTEVTYIPLDESVAGVISPQAIGLIGQELGQYDVLLIGCGLGQGPSVAEFIKTLCLGSKVALPPLVIDADALNTLAQVPNWWRQLPDDAILTPHPGEMARMAGVSVDRVQADRAGMAEKLARKWHKTVVLKGAYTVIAAPDGKVSISPFANPGLASAGTGDVLAGVIAGLVGQGLSLFEAAACGVYLHGRAGEMVREKMGDAGMVATDLLPVLPRVIKQLKEAG